MDNDKKTQVQSAPSRPTQAPVGRGRRGFTLVELMVSLAILGLVMTLVFSLFSTTSDGLKEADSLVDTLDRARFAMSQLSHDVKSAGAFASPDSSQDSWVIQKPLGQNLCVYGVAGYEGWQNSTTLLSTHDLLTAHSVSGTPQIGFDGLIVMGAIDFPQTFEVSNVSFGGKTTVTIPEAGRGVNKLLANNPFSMDSDSATFSTELRAGFVADLSQRLLRVADRDGNLQFGGIESPEDKAGTGIKVELNPAMQVRGGANLKGLQPETLMADDVGYEAALIDAYWYHVESDPRDPKNFRLVRERLNAHTIATQLCTPNSAAPSSAVVQGDKVVISDRVVDFQVWFDCANDQGDVSRVDWLSEWANPGAAGAGGDGCMDISATTPQFGAARMAHIRLSVRTRDERKDAPDAPDALFMDETGAHTAASPIRYFNLHPDAPGAARVVTVQADIDLNTFAMRNITYKN